MALIHKSAPTGKAAVPLREERPLPALRTRFLGMPGCHSHQLVLINRTYKEKSQEEPQVNTHPEGVLPKLTRARARGRRQMCAFLIIILFCI